MKNDTRLADWAIREVESKYMDDVCLLLEHKTLRLEKDMAATAFSHYVPATNKANGLARTFIVDGIGYDLFPMSWERIERMADVKEYNTTCLADGIILWARSDEDRQRFISLQERLQANLKNPQYMHERAKFWYNYAREIYADTLFEAKLYTVRENAGHICDLLSIAVAFVNGSYFTHGQTNQLQVLSQMKKLPDKFIELYRQIIEEASRDRQLQLCYDIINKTGAFFDSFEAKENPSSPDYAELASWYHELSYTWRRVYHWCDENDPVNAYIWCCNLQNEVSEMGKKYGISNVDILGSYNAKDLSGFRKQAEVVESEFKQAIKAAGVKLDEYATIEDFLAIY